MSEGFTVVNFKHNNGMVFVRILKPMRDGLMVRNEYLIHPDMYVREDEYLDSVMDAANGISASIIMRENNDVKTCNHVFTYMKYGHNRERKICIHCMGSFGYKTTQEVSITLN
jgi:hypothetical protein